MVQSNAWKVRAMRIARATTRATRTRAVNGGTPTLTVVRIATSAWTKRSNKPHQSNDTMPPPIALTVTPPDRRINDRLTGKFMAFFVAVIFVGHDTELGIFFGE